MNPNGTPSSGTESSNTFRLDALVMQSPEDSAVASPINNTGNSDSVVAQQPSFSENSGFITQDLGSSKVVDQQNVIKLDQLNTLSEDQTQTQKTSLTLDGEDDDEKDLRNMRIDYWEGMIGTNIFLVVCGLILVVLGGWNYYYHLMIEGVTTETDQQFIQTIDSVDQSIRSFGLGFDNYDLYVNLPYDGPGSRNNLTNLVQDTTLSYLDKRTILQQVINTTSSKIVQAFSQLEQAKSDIGIYGFFSKDLYNILSASSNNTSLQRSLLSLEAIKFVASMRVFSYLDTFISQFATTAGYAPTEIRSQISKLLQRGEKDINHYLVTCYLNPFETNNECTTIGDFDLLYTTISPEKDFNALFFKNLMRVIDVKLENTDFPSLSMMFQNFDPNSNRLSFNVEINTFQEDELELLQKGILNPHIFVVTNLINLLKESKYILGQSIDMKNLKVNKKRFKVGTNEFTVNNSMLNFNLPLQKTTQREIFDYKYDINASVPQIDTIVTSEF